MVRCNGLEVYIVSDDLNERAARRSRRRNDDLRVREMRPYVLTAGVNSEFFVHCVLRVPLLRRKDSF